MGQPDSSLPARLAWAAVGLATREAQGPHSRQATAWLKDSGRGKDRNLGLRESQLCQHFPFHPQDLWVEVSQFVTP